MRTGRLSEPLMCRCYNCDAVTPKDEVNPVQDYHERVLPGDTAVPAGECPKCGCLTYVIEREAAA